MILERQNRHAQLVETRKARVENASTAADEARALALEEAKFRPDEAGQRDEAAQKLQAITRGRTSRKEVAAMKEAQEEG